MGTDLCNYAFFLYKTYKKADHSRNQSNKGRVPRKAAELSTSFSRQEQNKVNECHYRILAASTFNPEQRRQLMSSRCSTIFAKVHCSNHFVLYRLCQPIFSIHRLLLGLLRHPFSIFLALNYYGISSIFLPKHGSGLGNMQDRIIQLSHLQITISPLLLRDEQTKVLRSYPHPRLQAESETKPS